MVVARQVLPAEPAADKLAERKHVDAGACSSKVLGTRVSRNVQLRSI